MFVAEDMKIAVIEPDRDRALGIIDALKEDGWQDVVVLAEVTGLARTPKADPWPCTWTSRITR